AFRLLLVVSIVNTPSIGVRLGPELSPRCFHAVSRNRHDEAPLKNRYARDRHRSVTAKASRRIPFASKADRTASRTLWQKSPLSTRAKSDRSTVFAIAIFAAL